jgi:hypothetical protein
VTWAICPIEDCFYALESDLDAIQFCPSCDMELISTCPACATPIEGEDQVVCRQCGGRLKS